MLFLYVEERKTNPFTNVPQIKYLGTNFIEVVKEVYNENYVSISRRQTGKGKTFMGWKGTKPI